MSNHMKRLGKALLCGVMSVTLLAGCEITNPGPVQDEFLALPASQQGLVNGAARRYAELMYAAYTAGLMAQEFFPGGQTGSFGHGVVNQGGEILPGSFGGYFNDAVQTRFIAETAIKRFTAVSAANSMMYQAHLWAGFAYRTMAEMWCDAVIGPTDPDDPTPGSFEAGVATYLARAESNLTAAMGFASGNDETFAAQGARAAVYAWQGDWANAMSDANAVYTGDPDFTFQVDFDSQAQAYYNAVYWANAYLPYAAYTMDFTWWKDEYTMTGDPRIPWFDDPATPLANAALSQYGPVPWSNQQKYTSRDDDMNVVSGWEMRLIMAEAELDAGNVGTAMGYINDVHTRNISDLDGVTPLAAVATSDFDPDPLTGAWSALMKERAVELWLEGRRMGDIRRWIADGRPGDNLLEDWSTISPIFVPPAARSNCFDIPDSERDANPNVPA